MLRRSRGGGFRSSRLPTKTPVVIQSHIATLCTVTPTSLAKQDLRMAISQPALSPALLEPGPVKPGVTYCTSLVNYAVTPDLKSG